MSSPQTPALVCLAQPAWDGDYVKSTVRLMEALAAHYRVLYVDYAYTLADAARAALGRGPAPLRRMLGAAPRLRRMEGAAGPLSVLTPPPVLPTRWMDEGPAFRAALQANGRALAPVIRGAMRRLGLADPIVVTAFAPQVGLPLVGRLGERRRVYYGYDEIAAAPWVGKHGGRLEAEFLAHADAVVVTSEGLRESRARRHPNVHLVPNGVDFELFSRAAAPARGGRPCVGFIGSLDDRVDYGLLTALITRRPDLDFLFVGRVTAAEGEALAAFPTVTLAGPHPPERLPGFLSRMDVGIIPFAVTRFTRSIYPLKLNEYLAAGRPVVTTPFAPLGDAERLVYTASDAEVFSRALDLALRDAGPAARARRIAFAEGNTWARRAEAFASAVEGPARAPSAAAPAALAA